LGLGRMMRTSLALVLRLGGVFTLDHSAQTTMFCVLDST
jgi:hypothetical protein